MPDTIRRLVVVPARGGSKRFPNKNTAMLGDKSLICHTLDTVVDNFNHVVFSSDSDALLDMVETFYVTITVMKRPDHLATDTSKVIDTVVYHFNEYKETVDEVWLCLPTCPLRTPIDIQEAQQILENDNYDGIISITDYEFPPTLGLFMRENGTIFDWDKSWPWQRGNTRSQDQQLIYRPNGAIYGMKNEKFKTSKNFYRGNITGYYMPRERSIDIDTPLDLTIAQAIYDEQYRCLSDRRNNNPKD